MTTLTLKLPEALDTQLTEAAKRRHSRKTALALQAIEAYLAQDTRPETSSKQPTVAELAGHLIGCVDVEGPTDLSTNKKYMEGFGE